MLLFFMACHMNYHRTRHTSIVCTCKNMKQTRDSQMLKYFKCLWAWSQWLYKTNDSLIIWFNKHLYILRKCCVYF